MHTKVAIALFMALALFAGTAHAQDDLTRGVQIGAHGGLTSWDLDPVDINVFEKESGPHFGASLGWGMSDWLGLYTRFDITSISPDTIDSYKVDHWDIGIRAIPQVFGTTVRPYVEAGGTFRFFNFEDPRGAEVKASGAGLGFGGGLYVFVTQIVAVNAGASVAFGSMDTVTFNGFDVDLKPSATSIRFLAGITVFP